MALERPMEQCGLIAEGEARRLCSPGHSPYWKAPYTDDRDPAREPPHMRDVMFHRVIHTDPAVLRGVVGNPKKYAGWVHNGTYPDDPDRGMYPRPFITDAIRNKEYEIRKILSEGVQAHLDESARGA